MNQIHTTSNLKFRRQDNLSHLKSLGWLILGLVDYLGVISHVLMINSRWSMGYHPFNALSWVTCWARDMPVEFAVRLKSLFWVMCQGCTKPGLESVQRPLPKGLESVQLPGPKDRLEMQQKILAPRRHHSVESGIWAGCGQPPARSHRKVGWKYTVVGSSFTKV